MSAAFIQFSMCFMALAWLALAFCSFRRNETLLGTVQVTGSAVWQVGILVIGALT